MIQRSGEHHSFKNETTKQVKALCASESFGKRLCMLDVQGFFLYRHRCRSFLGPLQVKFTLLSDHTTILMIVHEEEFLPREIASPEKALAKARERGYFCDHLGPMPHSHKLTLSCDWNSKADSVDHLHIHVVHVEEKSLQQVRGEVLNVLWCDIWFLTHQSLGNPAEGVNNATVLTEQPGSFSRIPHTTCSCNVSSCSPEFAFFLWCLRQKAWETVAFPSEIRGARVSTAIDGLFKSLSMTSRSSGRQKSLDNPLISELNIAAMSIVEHWITKKTLDTDIYDYHQSIHANDDDEDDDDDDDDEKDSGLTSNMFHCWLPDPDPFHSSALIVVQDSEILPNKQQSPCPCPCKSFNSRSSCLFESTHSIMLSISGILISTSEIVPPITFSTLILSFIWWRKHCNATSGAPTP